MSTETGACTKCASEISTGADRCPECGHEPGPGVLGQIFIFLAGMTGLLFSFLAFLPIILIFDGGSITDAVIGVVIFGGIATVCFGIVYAGYKSSEIKPTNEQLFG